MTQPIPDPTGPSPEVRTTGGDGETVSTIKARGLGSSPGADFPDEVPGFEILDRLGGGGMGVVYRARQVEGGRTVALKLIRGELASNAAWLRRFQTEAESMGRLRHPNILKIHKMGQVGATAYLALEFMPGGSLAARIGGVPQPIGWSARTAASIAAALGHMHQRGVLHRDLKPANVLLTEEGRPKVADFGLARQVPEAPWRDDESFACTIAVTNFRLITMGGGDAPLERIASPDETVAWREGPTPGTVVFETAAGSVLGTPSYMSPEQASGEVREVGPASDIYSLGALLHEMLLGRPPFRERTALETLARAVRGEVEPLRRSRPEIPPELEAICSRCLEREPNRRYPSAMHVVEDLRLFLATQGEKAELPTPATPADHAPSSTTGREGSFLRSLLRRVLGSG